MAEEKKEKPKPRHEKMYKDSPKLERKEGGKMGVTKGAKESAETNAGTEGAPEHDTPEMDMYHKHAKERLDMHHKHEKEFHALLTKNMKEGSAEEEAGESKEEEQTEKEKGVE